MTADDPIPPRGRATLADLMALVAAFAVGLGLTSWLGGAREGRLIAGLVVGATLVPYALAIVARRFLPPHRPLRFGEAIAYAPALMLAPLLPTLSSPNSVGLWMLWVLSHLVLAFASATYLIVRLIRRDGPWTGLECYGYALAFAMAVLAALIGLMILVVTIS